MSLITLEPPVEATKLVNRGLKSLLANRNTHTHSLLSRTSGGKLTIALPHPVYFLGADHLSEKRALSAAVLSGWRFLILRGTRARAAASVAFDAKNGRFAFANVSDSPFTSGTITALRRAARLKAMSKDKFEVRLLQVPALKLVSVWLHGSEDDYILPLPPAHQSLKPFKLYSDSAFAEALSDAAEKALKIVDARA